MARAPGSFPAEGPWGNLNHEPEFPDQRCPAHHLGLGASPRPPSPGAGLQPSSFPSPDSRAGSWEPRLGSGTRRGRPPQPRAATGLESGSTALLLPTPCGGSTSGRVDSSLTSQPGGEREPQHRVREISAGRRRRGRPGSQPTSRRTRQPPAGRARSRAPEPGGNPCRAANAPLRAGNRLGVLGAEERRARPLGSREELRAPRRLLQLSEESGAASSRSRSAARAPGAPSASLPARGGAAGGAAPPAGRGAGGGGGWGWARAPSSPPSQAGAGGCGRLAPPRKARELER